MFGMNGFYQIDCDYKKNDKWEKVLSDMNATLAAKDDDVCGSHLTPHAGFNQMRQTFSGETAVTLPLYRQDRQQRAMIAYCGEIYNMLELENSLKSHPIPLISRESAELVLKGYFAYGSSFFGQLDGSYILAIYDETLDILILCNGCNSTKTLYYQVVGNSIVFSSDTKGLASYRDSLGKFEISDMDSGYVTDSSKACDTARFLGDVRKVEAGHFLRIKGLHVRDNLCK